MAHPVETHQRDKWSHKFEFLLASIGWAVGYGNVWRFPYMCYQYGGAAFLIPYMCALLFAGVPVYAIELALGQYSSLGVNKVWEHLSPVFHGIGYGTIVVSLIVMIYFNLLISWSIYYLFVSFRVNLPWISCNETWNKPYCYSNLEDDRCRIELKDQSAMWYRGQCHDTADVKQNFINESLTLLRNKTDLYPTEDQIKSCRSELNDTDAMYFNKTCYAGQLALTQTFNKLGSRTVNQTVTFLSSASLTTPADDYFFSGVLRQSEGFHQMGSLHWELVVAQVVAWILVFACIFQGIKTSGKVVYVTVTFPYILMTILLIRGVTLDGAGDGLYFYLVPNMTKLYSIEIWRAAAVQIFYTYGVAFGVVVTFASYNQFNSNILKDAFIICCTDSLTSFYCGFAVFSTAGFIAKQLGRNVDEIIKQGTGLAFVIYPEAIARMPWSSFWAVVFFLMMILIGLDSQFPMIECPATAIMDEYPKLRRYKTLVFFAICVLGFVLGLPLCMDGGLYIFTLINDYSAGWCLMLLSLMEVLVVMWVYGFRRFKKDIELMAGVQNNVVWGYWMSCWLVITPVYLAFIFIYSLIKYAPSTVGTYVFPWGAELGGWILSLAGVAMVPIFAAYHIYKNRKDKRPLKELIEPTDQWCPSDERNRTSLGYPMGPVTPQGQDSNKVVPTATNYNNPGFDRNVDRF